MVYAFLFCGMRKFMCKLCYFLPRSMPLRARTVFLICSDLAPDPDGACERLSTLTKPFMGAEAFSLYFRLMVAA